MNGEEIDTCPGLRYAGVADVALDRAGTTLAVVTTAALLPEDTNSVADVYVCDMVTQRVERVSVKSGGGQAGGPSGPADGGLFPTSFRDARYRSVRTLALSGNGRWVAFTSSAPDLAVDDDERLCRQENDFYGWPFSCPDVFLHDRRLDTTELVSRGSDGHPADLPSGEPAVSDDGRYVAFLSYATRLGAEPGTFAAFEQLYVRDLVTGQTQHLSRRSRPVMASDGTPTQVYGANGPVRISGDGGTVGAGGLLYDRVTGVGAAVNGHQGSMSRSGRHVVFWREGPRTPDGWLPTSVYHRTVTTLG